MNAPEQWVGTFVPIQNQSNRAHRFENAGQCFRLVVFLRVFGFVWVGLSLSLSLSPPSDRGAVEADTAAVAAFRLSPSGGEAAGATSRPPSPSPWTNSQRSLSLSLSLSVCVFLSPGPQSFEFLGRYRRRRPIDKIDRRESKIELRSENLMKRGLWSDGVVVTQPCGESPTFLSLSLSLSLLSFARTAFTIHEAAVLRCTYKERRERGQALHCPSFLMDPVRNHFTRPLLGFPVS